MRCQGKNTSCETSAHPRARIAGGRSREYLFNELEGEPHRPSRAPRHWFLFQRSHARLCRRLRGAVRLPGVRRRCRGTSLGWLRAATPRRARNGSVVPVYQNTERKVNSALCSMGSVG